ncbi:hypothetical protein O9993_09395 [Vibrio lentus]|nr:hypothetical protein [Vibrio lentus]
MQDDINNQRLVTLLTHWHEELQHLDRTSADLNVVYTSKKMTAETYPTVFIIPLWLNFTGLVERLALRTIIVDYQ